MSNEPSRDTVLAMYGGYCCYPSCWEPATDVHHEPPKSLPGTAEQKFYPLCKKHHNKVQVMERAKAREKLELGAQEVLNFFRG